MYAIEFGHLFVGVRRYGLITAALLFAFDIAGAAEVPPDTFPPNTTTTSTSTSSSTTLPPLCGPVLRDGTCPEPKFAPGQGCAVGYVCLPWRTAAECRCQPRPADMPATTPADMPATTATSTTIGTTTTTTYVPPPPPPS